ncbi:MULTISPECIES: hypothetical protein [unclassified Stenotrophomonas]|uniref:hypothetical protein n=1 Tax=unclassified Stenotrophomonas TaxID=196198 RepID=UPI001F27DEF8|nr:MULTISPECIES: hypothetical protein [unclassified Stenotrophomonas]
MKIAAFSFRCAVTAVLALGAGGCMNSSSMESQSKEAEMSEDPTVRRTIKGHTYTTEPVEARIGPHRFMFPANYYDNQIGPYFDGSVGLTVLWPDLGPAPPGTRPDRSMEDFQRSVVIGLQHIDRTPIRGLLERYASTEQTSTPTSVLRNDPTERLDLRIPQPERFGLVPYAINEALMPAFQKALEQETKMPQPRNLRMEKDWYVARNGDGELTTFIKCESEAHFPDGLTISGDRLADTEDSRVAGCIHYFVDVEDSISITATYPRVILKDWKHIESAVRTALAKYKRS